MKTKQTGISSSKVEAHIATLRCDIDPASPFYRKVNWSGPGGLLSLPERDQWAIWNAMDEGMKAMFKEEMDKREKEAQSQAAETIN